MTTSQQQFDFKLMRCPICGVGLFYVAGAPANFSIRVKCRRCTTRQRSPVYVILQISLESPVAPAVDLNSENSACA